MDEVSPRNRESFLKLYISYNKRIQANSFGIPYTISQMLWSGHFRGSIVTQNINDIALVLKNITMYLVTCLCTTPYKVPIH